MGNRNPLKAETDKLQKLIKHKQELITQRIKIEYDILGVTNYVIYLGDTYCEQLYQKLHKNLTESEKIAYGQRIGRIRAMSKKSYNQYNVALLNKAIEEIRRAERKIRQSKARIDILSNEERNACKKAVFTPKELFGKENYWDLTEDERELYKRKNERANAEIRLQQKAKEKPKKYWKRY